MDVGSLLNSNPADAEQRKQADGGSSKPPSRSRTPWDAGGYSLPINTVPKSARMEDPVQFDNYQDDAGINSPPLSSGHKFSDSRSSLSSFASSVQWTTTHSRFSSTSTLDSNSHTHQKSLSTDILSPELRSIAHTLESAHLSWKGELRQATEPPQGASRPQTGSSLEQLAPVADNHLSEQGEEPGSQGKEMMDAASANLAAEKSSKTNASNRPGSPSDAVLIKRSSIPTLRVFTGYLSGHQQLVSYLSASLDNRQLSHLQCKPHKRTSSAPNFRPTFTTTSSLASHTNPLIFFDPSYSNASLSSERSYSIMENPPDPECDTGYNPSPETAKVSVNTAPTTELSTSVSTENVTNPIQLDPMAEPTPPSSEHPDQASPTNPPTCVGPSTPPVLGPANNQGIECMFVPNCDTGSQMRKAISHIFGRNKMCTRLIPQGAWVHYCRKHYQRSRYRNPKEYAKLQCDLVQTQIRRIHDWSEDNRRKGQSGVVQDWTLAIRKRERKRIDDLERKEANKNKRKRSAATVDEAEDEDDDDLNIEPSTAVPKWLQEKCNKQRYTTQQVLRIFNDLHREILGSNSANTFPDLEILPNVIVDNDGTTPSKYTKRRRHNVGQDGYAEELSHTMRPESAQAPVEGGRRMQLSAHHPMYTGMEEHHNNRDAQLGIGSYPHSTSSFQVPMPAPTPLRNPTYPLVTQLDHGSEFPHPMHARSQSDIGLPSYPVFTQACLGYHAQHPSEFSYYGIGQPQPGYGYPPLHAHVSDMHHHNPAHIRHQSYPIKQPSYPSPSPVIHNAAPVYVPPSRRNLPPSVPRAEEDEETGDMYDDGH